MNPGENESSVLRSLRLWNNTFRLADLDAIAESADTPQRHAARLILRAYHAGEIRASASDIASLKTSLQRNYKAERTRLLREQNQPAAGG